MALTFAPLLPFQFAGKPARKKTTTLLPPPKPPTFRLSAAASSAVAPPPSAELERRKHELLRAVQDTQRGLSATADQRSAIEEALVCVEEFAAGSPVDLARLDGTWRLNFTSAADVLVLFEAAARLPFLQVGQVFQKFECRDRSDGGIVRNVVRWSIPTLLEEHEGATLLVSAKFSLVSKRSIFLQFEEVAVENIKISEQLQALIAPAVLPRSYISLQILQFLRAFRAQVPVNGPDRRSPGGLYYLSYLDRDMLLGRSGAGGGVFVFTRAQPFT
ncbi:probable plastid-lipid-associated protein 10, chloroplastic [Ananas comosus]|uniref:Probable plastid-lipid-associated protein 10, chloroplastic n=1 Tax=Ananas comosus TaxID=4615 RepID=A0A6P5FGR9_ANACO|nr:probable plastid-lipid-associated protein 10, chloroplastic [Ananas comosus]XP_020094776.1 probable plastid-lipid-associated protein 10, chloroplastic [Ananas comosus]XP_020094777.1 probable plastid-lipid-associated protein 10, chloroplastic [Ananas comosus]